MLAALLAKASTAIILGFVTFLVVSWGRGRGCCWLGSVQYWNGFGRQRWLAAGTLWLRQQMQCNAHRHITRLRALFTSRQGWICQSVVVFGFPYTPEYIWDIPVVTVILTLLPWSPLAKACGALGVGGRQGWDAAEDEIAVWAWMHVSQLHTSQPACRASAGIVARRHQPFHTASTHNPSPWRHPYRRPGCGH